jgi:hypothetical protein
MKIAHWKDLEVDGRAHRSRRRPVEHPLVPHYWLGVFFVLAHLAAGGRAVVMAHGMSKAFADRFMVGRAVVAGIVATVIMLGICGMRVQFI